MRLIDADNLIEEIFERLSFTLFTRAQVKASILRAPTVEANTGIWRRMYNPYNELEGFIHKECGFSDTCAFNYCPSCGVKMDVEPARKNEKVANYEIIKKNVF